MHVIVATLYGCRPFVWQKVWLNLSSKSFQPQNMHAVFHFEQKYKRKPDLTVESYVFET